MLPRDIRLSQMAVFYIAVLLFFSIGAITTSGLGWYTTLSLPSWAPGQILTAVIWLSLFLCAAASMSVFLRNAVPCDYTRTVFLLYLGVAGLVLLWNYLFFGAHELTAALVAAALTAAFLIALTALLWKFHKRSALLLTPFLAWMAVALIFSYQIMVLN